MPTTPALPDPAPMHSSRDVVASLGIVLRTRRHAGRLTITALAAAAGVGPRLISEFERGRRSHVSLEVAVRLLQCVGVSLNPASASMDADEDVGRAERAARRRATWSGDWTTLSPENTPPPPTAAAARRNAVAAASHLAHQLQHAYRASGNAGRRP